VQSESQKVVYTDNHFVLSPYPTEGEQLSTVKVRSASILTAGAAHTHRHTHTHTRARARACLVQWTTQKPWRRSFSSVQPTPAAQQTASRHEPLSRTLG